MAFTTSRLGVAARDEAHARDAQRRPPSLESKIGNLLATHRRQVLKRLQTLLLNGSLALNAATLPDADNPTVARAPILKDECRSRLIDAGQAAEWHL